MVFAPNMATGAAIKSLLRIELAHRAVAKALEASQESAWRFIEV